MTRKDFVAIAKALRETHAAFDTVEAIADVFAASNPRFDRERFYTAAGFAADEDSI